MTVFATFKKKVTFNRGISPGEKECCCFRRKYNEKWDRLLATVTAVLTFMLLLTYVIYTALNDRKAPETVEDDDEAIIIRNKTDGESSSSSRDLDTLKCQVKAPCGVTCTGFAAADNISLHINEAVKNASCSSLQTLRIEQSKFLNQTINEGWLSPVTIPITSLVLVTNTITEMGAKAFAGHPFDVLKTLEMEDVPLLSLQANSFIGAKFETFSLTYTSDHTISMEERAFEGVNSTLTTLNIKRCLKSAVAITNLTGDRGSYFPKLTQIFFDYNSLTSLPNNSFLYAPSLVQVFLRGNKINSIERSAFSSLAAFSPIKSLYLSDNELSTLEAAVFSPFDTDVKVDTSNNPWYCNCSLQWLKDWYHNHTALNILDSLLCANRNNQKFDEVDFGCQEDNANSTKSTGPPSTSPSEGISHDYRQLQCVNTAATGMQPEDYYDDVPYYLVCVRTNLLDLEIYEVDAEAATYEVRLSRKLDNTYIMWYNTKNQSDGGCVANVDEKFIMEGLQREATYTICALYDGEATTSPYDCVGFVVPVEWGLRTWIPNKMMKGIIGGFCSILLIEAVITGLVVFYCIRQHPKLISGNKRVVLVSTKSTDAVIMPRSYSQSIAKETKPVASTPGYLTPKYAKKKRMMRSMSESSVLSGSYISKDEIYRRRRKETTLYEMSDEEHIYESPALPPNHPSEIRKQCCK